MTIFETLRESHDRQRDYVNAVIQTSGDTQERSEAYKKLKDELIAHARAEERHFYIPLMQHDNGIDPSRHGIAEHHEMDELMEQLDETDQSSPAWLPLAKKLKDKVLHHLQEEEHKFFQAAGKLLTEKQKVELSREYLKDYKDALQDH
jgi:hypothetical protein